MAEESQRLSDEAIERKWRWRRRAALVALAGLIALPALIIVLAALSRLPESLQAYIPFFNVVAAGLVSIVGAYMGLATWYERGR